MTWEIRHRADIQCRELADRHYNRQTVGAPLFAPPGRCLILYAETTTGKALWVTSWPYAEYTKHDWAGAWICSAFRNEGAGRASDLIREAVAATRAHFGEPPDLGMVTFINRSKVRPTPVHGVPTWGRTYRLAGFEPAGETQGGLMALQLHRESMPEPEPPINYQYGFKEMPICNT